MKDEIASIRKRTGCGWGIYSLKHMESVPCGKDGVLCDDCTDRATLLAEVDRLRSLCGRAEAAIDGSLNAHDARVLREELEAASK